MATAGHRYDAFTSYSHSRDAELAPVLQRLVERVGQRGGDRPRPASTPRSAS